MGEFTERRGMTFNGAQRASLKRSPFTRAEDEVKPRPWKTGEDQLPKKEGRPA